MIKRKKVSFATADKYLATSNDLMDICKLANALDRVNSLLENYSDGFIDYCHCGAIDYLNDVLVLYCSGNAAFHRVNNQVPYIRNYLESNNINFHKILVKVKPVNYFRLRKEARKPLTNEAKVMLMKFATAINRQDLIRGDDQEVENETGQDFEIKI